jgi:hypothetical protein
MNLKNLAAQAVVVALGTMEAGVALAQPKPPAPEVTVGAGLKHLVFDWNRAPRADYYQLYYRRNAAAEFVAVGDRIPSAQTQARANVAVHLHDWAGARYKVAACNGSGCSESVEISVASHMLDAIGYFKASNTGAGDFFGTRIALSRDGRTLVVAASSEDSNASGVNGDQANDASAESGAVYVFRRSGGGWAQEAYLKAGINQPDQGFGAPTPIGLHPLSISADGSLLAVGSPNDMVNFLQFSGRVYLFARDAAGNWSLTATLQRPVPERGDFFGTSVDLSHDGQTLKVSSLNPKDGEGVSEGRTHLFVRTATGFVHQSTIEPFYPGDNCHRVVMSKDAGTLLQYCQSLSTGEGRIVTLKRSGAAWTHVSDLAAGHTSATAIDDDASRLAVQEAGPTVFASQVSIFRWTGTAWLREHTVVPESFWTSEFNTFGNMLAFSGDGRRLAIGDSFTPIGGAGVMPAPVPGTSEDGAVFFYERRAGADPLWSLRSVVKAPNPDTGDGFGLGLALSGNGRVLAVGAPFEDSAATGVDGNQLDNSAENSGAVYLY